MFSVRSDVQKWCGDVVGGVQFFFFWGGGVFADILGQMEQRTTIHTKDVLDWMKCFIQLGK